MREYIVPDVNAENHTAELQRAAGELPVVCVADEKQNKPCKPQQISHAVQPPMHRPVRCVGRVKFLIFYYTFFFAFFQGFNFAKQQKTPGM